MQFSISVQGDKELKLALRGYNQKIRKGLQQQVSKTTYDIRNDAAEDVRRNRRPPHGSVISDTGTLANSITSNVTDLTGATWVGVKYGGDVEGGTSPGRWPNMQDIKKWVENKLKVPKNKSKSVAYLVSRKIFRQGTPAQPYFEPAVKENQPKFFKNVKRMVERSRL
jgi:hypothetical protein